MSAGRREAIGRRAVLAVLAAGGAGSLAAACRSAGSADDQVIRAWFRAHHDVELVDEAIGPIRDYLQKPLVVADPVMQPPLLFDPEVDAG